MTIPGIGKAFAVLVAAEIDDIGQFATRKQLHTYAGLVPSTYSSGGRTFRGRITKRCHRYQRWAMVEAVWPAVQKEAKLNAFYYRLAGRKAANPGE